MLFFVLFFCHYYLLDFCLEMSQLDALFQMSPVLLCTQVQLLLLLVEELQQVLHSCGHIHISVAQQLHTCRTTFYYLTATIFWENIYATDAQQTHFGAQMPL